MQNRPEHKNVCGKWPARTAPAPAGACPAPRLDGRVPPPRPLLRCRTGTLCVDPPEAGLLAGVVRRDQLQGDRIDAIALVCRGAVAFALEHMAKVGITRGAADFDPFHAQGAVVDVSDRPLGKRGPEGGPAAVRIELLDAGEQLGAASAALIDASGVCVPVLPGVGAVSYTHLTLPTICSV